MNWPEGIRSADKRIRPWVIKTPLVPALSLGPDTGTLFFKLETVQITHSFKVRGAFSKLTILSPEERSHGIVAASSGNHGAGVAYGAKILGCRATLFVPTVADPAKVDRIRAFGAEVHIVGDDCVETEGAARNYALTHNQTYISPYNDADVVCGQGTVGIELLQQAPDLDAVIVAVGGGGLIGGIGAILQDSHPSLEVIAASPAQSPALHEALEAGEIVDTECGDTWSDATAGGIEAGSITLPLCQSVITRSVLCSEAEIKSATRKLLVEGHYMVEGAAGLAYAAYLQIAQEYANKKVAVVLCGAAIGPSRLLELLTPQ